MAPTITATEQSVFPPRVIVAVAGLLPGGGSDPDYVQASLHRVVEGVRTPLRGATGLDVTGDDAVVRVDGEQPFGVAVRYLAVLTDDDGVRTEVLSDPVTTTITAEAVLSDAISGVGVPVAIHEWSDKKHDRESSTFAVGGRVVVVSAPRQSFRSSITLFTTTAAHRRTMGTLLDQATQGVVLLRQDGALDDVDAHLAVLSDSQQRVQGMAASRPRRAWTLEVVEAEPWPDVLEASGYTLQDLADHYEPDGTLDDLADDFTPGTLLDIALHDWGST